MSINEIIVGGLLSALLSIPAYLFGRREKVARAKSDEVNADQVQLKMDIEEKEYDRKRYKDMFERMAKAETQRDDNEKIIFSMHNEILQMKLQMEKMQAQITILKTVK